MAAALVPASLAPVADFIPIPDLPASESLEPGQLPEEKRIRARCFGEIYSTDGALLPTRTYCAVKTCKKQVNECHPGMPRILCLDCANAWRMCPIGNRRQYWDAALLRMVKHEEVYERSPRLMLCGVYPCFVRPCPNKVEKPGFLCSWCIIQCRSDIEDGCSGRWPPSVVQKVENLATPHVRRYRAACIAQAREDIQTKIDALVPEVARMAADAKKAAETEVAFINMAKWEIREEILDVYETEEIKRKELETEFKEIVAKLEECRVRVEAARLKAIADTNTLAARPLPESSPEALKMKEKSAEVAKLREDMANVEKTLDLEHKASGYATFKLKEPIQTPRRTEPRRQGGAGGGGGGGGQRSASISPSTSHSSRDDKSRYDYETQAYKDRRSSSRSSSRRRASRSPSRRR